MKPLSQSGMLLRKVSVVVALGLVFGPLRCSSQGQTLYLSPSGTNSAIRHTFIPASDGLYNMNRDDQYFTLPSPSIHLSDYNKIVMEVNAPAGQAWSVHLDPVFTSPVVQFEMVYGSVFSAPWDTVTSAELTLSLANGGYTTFSMGTALELVPESGDRFDLYGSFTPGHDIAFTGFTLTIDYDNTRLSGAALVPLNFSRLTYLYYNGVNPDPGSQLTLVAVPEPAVLGIGLLGALVIAWGKGEKRTTSDEPAR